MFDAVVVAVACVATWINLVAAYQFQLADNQKSATVRLDLSEETLDGLNNADVGNKFLVTLMNINRRQNATPYEMETSDDEVSLDSWSVVWYMASFGGLIAFFLVVSCSEWCCRKPSRRSSSYGATSNNATTPTAETPPPSYDHFAPPSYESLAYAGGSGSEKREFDIYVVPAHALQPMMTATHAQEDSPPTYSAAEQARWGRDNSLRVGTT